MNDRPPRTPPHRFTHAIVRRPATTLASGLTTSALGSPDHALALAQFDTYVGALRACGLSVDVLDPLADCPDAHFVEDTAVVLPEAAVVARPGAPSRRDETDAMVPVLTNLRPVHRIVAPGTLDGGDVIVDRDVAFIELSARTNEAGAAQLGAVLTAHGIAWRTVPVGAGLHFKSSVNLVGDRVLLMTAEFAAREELAGYATIVVPADESYACNTLLINGRLIMPSGYPATRRLLEPLGHEIIEIDTSEFRKMDGGLTCLSLRF